MAYDGVVLDEISHPGHRMLEQAIAAHQAGRLAEAEGLYQAYLHVFPDHPGANHNLGVLLAQQGHPDQGVCYLKRATEVAPTRVQHWVSYAEALSAAGDAGKAKQVLATAQSRGLAGAVLEQALSRMARGPGDEAGRLFQEAIAHHQAGQLEKAAEAYRKLLSLQPDLPAIHCNLGSALKAAGHHAEAKIAFERALALAPKLASAHFNLGNLYREQQDWDAAARSYRAALDSKSDFAEAHNNLGSVWMALGKPEDAIASFRHAIRLKRVFPSAFNNLGNALRQTGEAGEAKIAFETALQQDPRDAEAHNSLGALLSENGKYQEAEELFQRALALRPDYLEAHNNLANLLVKRPGPDRLADAIGHYQTVLRADPGFIEAYDHLGLALCKAHRVPEAFTWFTRGAQRRVLAAAAPSRSPHKAVHDEEQRAWRGHMGLTGQGGLLIEGGQALSASVVQKHASRQAEEQWRSANPQIVVIDHLLTEEALAALRRFCLASTIWSESFEDGYLGARPESGFASPLLAQIAEELRAAYPAIFRDHPLLYAWSFKYDNRLKGTKIHADFAAVNVNFWITPDEANLDPDRGGLLVWDVAAPLDWDFERYNRDESAIRKFLKEHGARAVRIPHCANRAVIFDSDLFHETDEMTFADGYENRRINITLLYGDRRTAVDQVSDQSRSRL